MLSELSSSPTTLDRQVTIYLQSEQSFSRRLSANNVKEHTAGSLWLYPLSQEFACNSDDPMVCAITPLGCSIFQKRNQPVPPFSPHPSFQSLCSPVLSQSVLLFASAEASFYKPKKRWFNRKALCEPAK